MESRRLGTVIIINNVAESIPGSKKDVEALKDVLQLVLMFMCEDCNENIMSKWGK